MRFTTRLTIFVFVLLLPVSALAKPLVTIAITAEKVVAGGKRTAASATAPGDTLAYTIAYMNRGDEKATNAVIDDPIPRGTTFIPGSAYGARTEIVFSIDGGKTFKRPSLLTYEVRHPDGTVEKRTASPERYTHIRWIISTIPAGANGRVGFRVRVK